MKTETASGQEVLEYLKETGTGESRLRVVEDFLRDNDEATGAEVMEHMQAAGVQSGTIRKVGEFLFGPSYSDGGNAVLSTNDEITRLREELTTVKQQLALQSAKGVTLTREVQALTARNAILLEQVQGIRLKESGNPEKRGPGRPRKAKEAEGAEGETETESQG